MGMIKGGRGTTFICTPPFFLFLFSDALDAALLLLLTFASCGPLVPCVVLGGKRHSVQE